MTVSLGRDTSGSGPTCSHSARDTRLGRRHHHLQDKPRLLPGCAALTLATLLYTWIASQSVSSGLALVGNLWDANIA